MFSMNDYPVWPSCRMTNVVCLTMASIASVRCSGVTSSLELSTTRVHIILQDFLLDERAYQESFKTL